MIRFDGVIGSAVVRTLAKGELLIEEREPSRHVFVLVGGVVGVYQHHKFEREVRLALDRWGAHVEILVAGRPTRNVVELPRVTA